MEGIIQSKDYTVTEYFPDQLGALEKTWRKLEVGPDMTAFQTYDWYSATVNDLYYKERIKRMFRRWKYFLVSRAGGGMPVLIAPLSLCFFGIGYKGYGMERGVSFIEGNGFTDYLNFIYDDFNAEALDFLFQYIKEKYKLSRFYLKKIVSNSCAGQWISERFRPYCKTDICECLSLPSSFEEYQNRLSKSSRQNIRTAINRAERDGVVLQHEWLLNENAGIKAEIKRIHDARMPKKAQQSRRESSLKGKIYCSVVCTLDRLFSAKQDVLYDCKNTACFLVRDDNRIVGCFWGIPGNKDDFCCILSGVDAEYERYSPCISHLYLYIKESIASEGKCLKILDFTRGAEPYKKAIGCEEKKIISFLFRV